LCLENVSKTPAAVPVTVPPKKPSLFDDDSSDLFGGGAKTSTQTATVSTADAKPKASSSLFAVEDDVLFTSAKPLAQPVNQNQTTTASTVAPPKKVSSLFADEGSDDLFGGSSSKPATQAVVPTAVSNPQSSASTSSSSLFGGEDDVLFASSTQKANTKQSTASKPSKLFEDNSDASFGEKPSTQTVSGTAAETKHSAPKVSTTIFSEAIEPSKATSSSKPSTAKSTDVNTDALFGSQSTKKTNSSSLFGDDDEDPTFLFSSKGASKPQPVKQEPPPQATQPANQAKDVKSSKKSGFLFQSLNSFT
jgi:hypothetical protein